MILCFSDRFNCKKPSLKITIKLQTTLAGQTHLKGNVVRVLKQLNFPTKFIFVYIQPDYQIMHLNIT